MIEDSRTTIDAAEIEHFSRIASQWWDPKGKFRPLHKFNPTRLTYIREKICTTFDRDPKADMPLKGLRILDIGCGGGLLCEPLARLGADIVGADASSTNIEVARIHSRQSGLAIDYRATTAESLAQAGEKFDIVLNMEVVEHVADVALFMSACGEMVNNNGLMFVATINRTLKAWGLVIIGAEYILRWLPKSTHSYEKFLRPDELKTHITQAGLHVIDATGVTYNPLRDNWQCSTDMDANYMLLAQRVT